MAARFGVTFESASPLVRAPIDALAGVMAQSPTLSIRWNSPIYALYWADGGFPSGITFYSGDTVLKHDPLWATEEMGYISTEPFDRVEFQIAPGKVVNFVGLHWAVPAPAAGVLLLLAPAAMRGRRRRMEACRGLEAS
jgi:hypothetical protein